MPKIKIEPFGVQQIQSVVLQQSRAIGNVANVISQVSSNLDIQISAREGISRSLYSLRAKAVNQENELLGIANMLTKVIDGFQRTDSHISKQAESVTHLADKIMLGLAEIISFLNGLSEGERIYNYLRENDPTHLFGRYNYTITFIEDVGFFELYGYVAKDWLRVFSIIGSGGTMEEMTELFMNDPDKSKALLRSVIDDLCDTEYLDVFTAKEEEMLDIVRDLAESCGCDSSVELMDMINDYIGDAETVDKLLKDYSSNIVMLESIKDVVPNNSVLADTVDALIDEYKNQSKAFFMDELKKEVEDGLINVFDFAVGSEISIIDAALQKVLGESEVISSIEKVVSVNTIRCEAIQSFRNAAEIIQSGNYTDDDLLAYKNSFNLAKSLTITEYQGMLDYYGADSEQGKYLKFEIDQLESMKCDDFNYAIGFKEYQENHSMFSTNDGQFESGGASGGRF